ncbi:MAG: ATP-binding protein [Thermomicrobiales bacterium]
MSANSDDRVQATHYVGTIVGESTSREFRLAVAHETIREQDIIAVDAELRSTDPNVKVSEHIRVWAKVQRIERLNPLFPSEAGHELAATQTNPFDTVLSLSREMVTAVCQVLGTESMENNAGGKLDHLRYPAQPASTAYRPSSADIGRVVLGDLQKQKGRALDIATLSNRPEVDVLVDGHAIVTRHLAVLAMTGAGKSWTARRIIEQLAEKNYPIVIFDPHGDYSRLAEVDVLRNKVCRYYAQFPVFEQESETVAKLVGSLGYDELTPTMYDRFSDVFHAAKTFAKILTPSTESDHKEDEIRQYKTWLEEASGDDARTYGIRPDMWLIAHLAAAGEQALQSDDNAAKQRLKSLGWNGFDRYDKRDIGTVRGIKARTRSAAAALRRMEQTNRRGAAGTLPLPTDHKELVRYGGISVISLAGYTKDFQATIYSLIAEKI